MRRRIFIATALAAGLATVTVAHAQTGGGSAPRWATVNSCAPTAVGVRASLPGDGSGKRMRVRFTAQYWSYARRAWVPVAGAPSSPWLDAGSARHSYGQAGWTFQFDPLPAGTHYQVRGLAEMQWLSGGSVASSATMVTQGGARSDVGGSQASCRL
jgi:hypothetical protein